jgi:hypothetical protein
MDLRFRLSQNQVSDTYRPIFIVGCGQSGTTLLLKILGAQSRLHAINFESAIAFKPEKSRELAQQFNRMCSNAGKVHWVEKTPMHIHKISVLIEMFPDARILVMLRDGRDVACSIRRRTGDLAVGIERWVTDNTAAVPALSQDNVMVVRYENLIGDVEACTSEILNFCGEDYEPGIKEFYKYQLDFQDAGLKSKWASALFRDRQREPNEHRTRRQQQIHQELFDGRNAWKQELSADEKDMIKKRAGELLQYFAYTDGLDW